MACACSLYDTRSDWLIPGNYSPVVPARLQKQSKTPYNKHFIYLERSVFPGNLKPRPSRVDLAITWSIPLGVGL